MTKTEQQAMYAATCHICTLSAAMRDCETCLFREAETRPHIYLPPMTKVLSTMPVPEQVDDAFGQLDLGTHVVISGGEVLELYSFLEPRFEEGSELLF